MSPRRDVGPEALVFHRLVRQRGEVASARNILAAKAVRIAIGQFLEPEPRRSPIHLRDEPLDRIALRGLAKAGAEVFSQSHRRVVAGG